MTRLWKRWKRKVIGSAVAIFLLLFAASLFDGAIAVSRVDSLVAESDARLEAYGSASGWQSFLKYPVNRWFVERLGDGEDLELRRIYVSLDKGDIQDARTRLQKLADSDNPKIASLALTLLGDIYVLQALSNNDGELLEQARQIFGKAVVLDPGNESAKFNLELLSFLRRMSGDQGGENGDGEDSASEDDGGDLPLDVLPGGEGGEPGEYSGY